MFFGHGNVQHAGSGQKGKYEFWYHPCLLPEAVGIKILVAYGYWMQWEVRNKYKVLLGDENPLFMSDEKNGADGSLSSNMISLEMAGGKNENSDMIVWSEYSMGSSVEKD